MFSLFSHNHQLELYGQSDYPGQKVRFEGIATDAEEGDLSSQITWSSNRDGNLGKGTPISVNTLTTGRHTITAFVRDSRNQLGIARIGVSVSLEGGTIIILPTPIDIEAEENE